MEFRDILDGKYKISDDGTMVINNKTNRVLTQQIDGRGYWQVRLQINGKQKHFRIHSLVAKTFIPNPENKPTVDHINRIKTDNRKENLRWATSKEQAANRDRLDRLVLNENDVIAAYKDGEKIGEYKSVKKAAQECGISYTRALTVVRGVFREARGIKFCYESKDSGQCLLKEHSM